MIEVSGLIPTHSQPAGSNSGGITNLRPHKGLRRTSKRTGAQLERKRVQDRESQRNVRERNKRYIASLEERLAKLDSPNRISDLLKENERLRQKVESLESVLQTIVEVAKKQSCSSDSVSVADNLPPSIPPHAPILCNEPDDGPNPQGQSPPQHRAQPSSPVVESEGTALLDQPQAELDNAENLVTGTESNNDTELPDAPSSVDVGETEEIADDFGLEFSPSPSSDFMKPSAPLPSLFDEFLRPSIEFATTVCNISGRHGGGVGFAHMLTLQAELLGYINDEISSFA